MYTRILVPVDGSETSARGLDEAVKLARSEGSQLRLVHVVNELILDSAYVPGACSPDVIVSLREEGRKLVTELESRVRQAGVKVDGVLIESIGGPAADPILEQARVWPADLIVMGTHGRRGIARLALGSDAERVLRGATVPVLLVRNAPLPAADSAARTPPSAASVA